MVLPGGYLTAFPQEVLLTKGAKNDLSAVVWAYRVAHPPPPSFPLLSSPLPSVPLYPVIDPGPRVLGRHLTTEL